MSFFYSVCGFIEIRVILFQSDDTTHKWRTVWYSIQFTTNYTNTFGKRWMVLLHSIYLYTHVLLPLLMRTTLQLLYYTVHSVEDLTADVCKQHSAATVCLRARTGFSSFRCTFNLLTYIVCLFPSIVRATDTGRCFVVTHGNWIGIDFGHQADDRKIKMNGF